jgi:Fur family ferric uptake transcriptional regulator
MTAGGEREEYPGELGVRAPFRIDPAILDRLRARLTNYMAEKGLRSTQQRRLIVDTFFEGASHMTIEDLLNEVRSRDRGIGYATVYRTLKLLAECGVASERKFSDGLSRYELADEASAHHDHLICVSCGKITEFEEPRIEALQDEIAARHHFEVTSHKHEMYGTCSDCAAISTCSASTRGSSNSTILPQEVQIKWS